MTMPDKIHFLCSCPDYLHGTGKPTKKKTTCKQCKGIKLPFAPIGGTVRMIASPYVFDPSIARNCVGTVRLPSHLDHRQRPTILCGDHDPYDFLRQSRLLYGDRSDLVGTHPSFQTILSNGPTSSAGAAIPSNGISSLLRKKRLPTTAKVTSRIIDSFAPLIPDAYSSRNILPSTAINPYELISSTLHNNEFAPGSSLFNLMSHSDRITGGNDPCGTIAIRTADRQRQPELNVLETFAPRSLNRGCNTLGAIDDSVVASTTVILQPPPLPAVESLPLSVKTVPDRFTKNVDALKKASIASSRATTCAAKYKSILKQSAAAQVAANAANTMTAPTMPTLNQMRTAMIPKESSDIVSNRIRCIDVPPNVRGLQPSSTHIKTSPVDILSPRSSGSRPKFATMSVGDSRAALKKPKSSRILIGTATIGRLKKVQFNTEPELERPKSSNSIAEYDDVCSDSTTNEPFYVNTSPVLNTSNEGPSEFGINYNLGRLNRRMNPIQRSMSDRRDRDASEKLNFKDTTALRTKVVRVSPQQLFQQRPLSLTLNRPTIPPPKLPAVGRSQLNQPQRPPRHQKKHNGKMAPIDDTKALRIFGLLPVSTINRNRIQIQPFANGSDKPAMRPTNCELNGNDSSATLQKTSITINTDDCLSMVNVRERVKLYRSSVIINNESNTSDDACVVSTDIEEEALEPPAIVNGGAILNNRIIDDKYDETILLGDREGKLRVKTSKCGDEDAATEIAIVYHNNSSGSTKKLDVLEKISTNISKTKTLICLDYTNNPNSEHSLLRSMNTLENVTSSHSIDNTNSSKNNDNNNNNKNDDDDDDDDDGDRDGDDNAISENSSNSSKSTLNNNGIYDKNANCNGTSKPFADSFILKLLNDPYLSYLLHGLEIKTIAKIIENSLIHLRANQRDIDKIRATKDINTMDNVFLHRLHDIVKEERNKINTTDPSVLIGNVTNQRQRHNLAAIKNTKNCLDRTPSMDYYEHEMRHKRLNEHVNNKSISIRKLYEMLIDTTFWANNNGSIDSASSSDSQSDHQYESICLNCDPIYEEINDKPPPLPLNPPPIACRATSGNTDKQLYKPFLGATKYDILSYLVDAKERGIVPDESYTFKFLRRPIDECPTSLEQIPEATDSTQKGRHGDNNTRNSDIKSYTATISDRVVTSIERNDSGVGSETSKTSRTKYQPNVIEHKSIAPIHLCEDCDDPIELQLLDTKHDLYVPIVCRGCGKKRAERREILWEFIETEKKYSRDLQIIIDEFYQPMLVAGLLTQEQLSAIFLNIEELLENSEAFCARIRDAFDAANEHGDDDLFTVDIGRIILDNASMLCAFETYCIQQAAASLLLANMEKDKELLRIFLRVSQMENTVLRRMNLNSFLMVPVQRVTKYPLLLARLYKVTPEHIETRERLKEAREKIECHLNRMNREAKDISTKLWRRLSSNPTRTRENDIVNIKLRKVAMDFLEWAHEKVHFVVEGKLLITHPTDNNWRKGRTIKLTPVHALLVTNELASTSTPDHSMVNFPRYTTNKETAFLLIREKSGRYTLYHEPFYLDRCVICTESDSTEYFEVHEILSKDSFIFKAEDDARTKHWYTELQYHAQGTGAWRKRRTALANIMINGMMVRP